MDIAAEELSVPPGMDELFSLLQIKRHHESGEFDVVIVDCAPTGETLRLLGFPRHRPLVAGEGVPLGAATGRRGEADRADVDVEVPDEEVFGEVQRLVRHLIAMNEILRDSDAATIRLVINPDRMVIKEAQRTFTYLNLYGYLTDAVVVNRMFPDEVADGYFGAWRDRQRERLEEVRAGFAPLPVLEARYFEEEVVGAADARPARRRAVRATVDAGGGAPHRAHPARSSRRTGRQLRINSRSASAGDVGLKKVGAELIVSVGRAEADDHPARRRSRGDARRGAKLEDGALEVSFETSTPAAARA